MKKNLLTLIVAMMALLGVTACGPDYDGYYWDDPGPGYGNNSFNDHRLTGYWELVQYNSDPVNANETNYLYFNGNGNGYYYYLDSGIREVERTRYYSLESDNGASDYVLNINYEYSNPLRTSYWFTHGNNTLWMQWRTSGGRVQTYVYDRIDGAPW